MNIKNEASVSFLIVSKGAIAQRKKVFLKVCFLWGVVALKLNEIKATVR